LENSDLSGDGSDAVDPQEPNCLEVLAASARSWRNLSGIIGFSPADTIICLSFHFITPPPTLGVTLGDETAARNESA
jgi:hypothetical protein